VVLFSPRLLVNCPLVPHCSPLFPASLPSGFPQSPNVLLIRTHPNPSPSVANTDNLIILEVLLLLMVYLTILYLVIRSLTKKYYLILLKGYC
jgi:hypothetical protein